MNKYQKSLNTLRKEYLNNESKECDILQELVDKSTPKKIVIKDSKGSYIKFKIYCPTCGKIVDRTNNPYGNMLDIKYCDQCGQRLDWSDEYDL